MDALACPDMGLAGLLRGVIACGRRGVAVVCGSRAIVVKVDCACASVCWLWSICAMEGLRACACLLLGHTRPDADYGP